MLKFEMEESLFQIATVDELLSDKSINDLIDQCLDPNCEDLEIINDNSFVEHHKDSEFHFKVSQDKMSVIAGFYPSSGNGYKLVLENIKNDLSEENILESLIDIPVVSDSIKLMNDSGKPVEDVPIAMGILPIDEIPSHITLIIDPVKYISAINEIITTKKTENIDYKKYSSLCILDEAIPVAKVIQPVSGVNGMDVYGNMIKFQTVEIEEIKIGKNLRVDEYGDVVTIIEGEFVNQFNEIHVNEILHLKNGVNYETGNIRYPGSVLINGEIEDDFSVETGKNLFVFNALAASGIKCGGDLKVYNGGIIGRKQKRIYVKGSVETVHTEVVQLEAGGDIYIEKGSINSYLYTNGIISMGSQSRIIGGQLYAKKGLHAADIGNKSYIETKINCGIDYRDINSLLLIRKYRSRLLEERKVSIYHNNREILKKIDYQILKCDLSLEHKLHQMDYYEKAEVRFTGTVYPGTIISICHVQFTVTENLYHGIFSLDKKSGEIRFEHRQ